MTDYQKSARSLTQNEAFGVLHDCRDLALTRLTRTLSAMLDKIDDDLNELADKAVGLDEQHAFLNARREARLKRTAIEAVFKKQFMALFGEKATGKPEQSAPADPFAELSLELSLVDDKEVEENIAISNMATALQDNCESELQPLAARIAFLLNSPDFDLKANPVSPEVIHNTFKAACQQIEAGFTVKLAIMRLFDRYLAKDLPAIYKEINTQLASKAILPEIRAGYRGKPRPSATPRMTAPQAGAPSAEQGQAAGAFQPTDNPQEVFALLQQLLTKGSQPLSNALGQPSLSPNAFNHGAFAQSEAPSPQSSSLTSGFLDSLNRLQHGDSNLLASFASGQSIDAFTQGTMNLLHEIRNSSFAAGVGQFDAITIDIVAMLFDYIFEDPKIPSAMKNLIGRLQIPVLKVAMLDKGFFSSKTHPTRKLLDKLGSAAISRGDQLSQTDPLYKETERIVQRVLSDFESDVSIFETLIAELDGFLAKEEKQDEQNVERSAKVIHDRERLEIARLVAEDEVKQRIDSAPTITVVRNFLTTSWVHALTSAHANAGEEGETWKDWLKAMDELLWSVKPKMTADERKELVTRLPGLLKRLHAGMAAISMDLVEQKQFFADLVSCHTRAVKAGLGGDVSHPEVKPELAWTMAEQRKVEETPTDTILDAVNEANEESALIRKNVAEGDVQLEEVTLAKETLLNLDSDRAHELTQQMSSLKRGSWVDFKQEDGKYLRYKLSWVSPLKKVYLFTNVSNQKALSISPQAMEAQLRNGTALILEDTPLIDRAVENMLENLQHQQ